eukprot:5760504-Pyramimonas_sp.AAC.1
MLRGSMCRAEVHNARGAEPDPYSGSRTLARVAWRQAPGSGRLTPVLRCLVTGAWPQGLTFIFCAA